MTFLDANTCDPKTTAATRFNPVFKSCCIHRDARQTAKQATMPACFGSPQFEPVALNSSPLYLISVSILNSNFSIPNAAMTAIAEPN
ncbi:MAG: hypothetical protein AAGH78_06095 [Cyanobacteria bacterium P01_H01_bin.58]